MKIEIYYNHPAAFGPGWATGSRRFYDEAELVKWLLTAPKPVLVTHIENLK